MLNFSFESAQGETIAIEIDRLVIAGWTGRNQAAVEEHIRELAALGVPAPGSVPLFYRASAALLTQQPVIDVVGDRSSGEAEPFVFRWRGEYWLTLASDHTDRQLENHSVALSKQVCAKPLARVAWRLGEVADDWDRLLMQSWIREQGGWHCYQQGRLAELRRPEDLLSHYLGDTRPADGLGMSCGTLSVPGGIRPGAAFRMALTDERRGRKIEHEYRVETLPLVA